ncbi:thiamine pyrophosphate-binding protein [Kiloniella laminariae]|uniref:thiamine pyrophosphate-binding protein n=1 Tax=Kiloniella laminariae TaxID=454162 RepID=UPI000476F89E|nr:thiamine pyrophosphate-binding protein [Kiloniella laminariae]
MSLTSADILARRLYDAGCRHAFGIPGGEVLSVMHALDQAGVEIVLTKHENGAGFMAEGCYHRTGAPGVLFATLGPGMANAFNVIANAYQDRVPLVFLTGRVDDIDIASYTHQVFDHVKALEPVVKGSFTLVDGAVDRIVDRALSLAMSGRPGPVHIDVPISLAAKVQKIAEKLWQPAYLPSVPAVSSALTEIRDRLATAKRPLAVLGLEILSEGCAAEVRAFLLKHGIPSVATYKAKGVVPDDHPLSLGGAGLSPKADKEVLPLLSQSDCLLLIGYDPIEMRHGWQDVWQPGEQFVAEFILEPNLHGMHRASHTFVGSLAPALAVLDQGLSRSEAGWPEGEFARAKDALVKAFPTTEEWGPAAIVDEVRKALPDHGIASVDSGAHRILQSQQWVCREPHTLIQSSGLCTMGCALPLAMGAKVASPDLPVVAFTGDAGLEMILGELSTLRDLKLPVVVVVFVDASLALIELKQRGSGRDNLAVDFGGTDFAALARAMGGVGIDARNRAEMAAALEGAFTGDRFTLIAAHIDREAYDGRF